MEGKSRGGKCCLRPAAGLLAALFLLIPLPVLEAQGVFVRGDCDQNQKYEITDPIFLLSFLFLGTREPTCFSACDSNDSDALDISDPLYSLSYLFLGGPAPPPPFPLEDPDPTGTKLTCLNGRNPPHELLVTPKEIFFYRIGNVQALSVLVLNDAGSLEDVHLSKSTRYLSADEAISLISSQGIVTAKAVGEATVEVHYRGVTRSVKVHVVPGADGSPVVRITQPQDGSIVTSEKVLLSGLVSDPQASLLLSGAPLNQSGGSFSSVVNLPLGATKLEVVATGSRGQGRASVTVTRAAPGSPEAVGPDGKPLPVVAVPAASPADDIPPLVSITSPPQGATLRSGLVSVTGTVDDSSATVRVNGIEAVGNGTTFQALLRLPPGDSTIRAEAVDPVGNRSEAQVQVKIDGMFPRVSITSPPGAFASVVGTSSFTVKGTVDPPGTPVSVNGLAAQVAGSNWSVQLSLAAGAQDLIATASLGGSPPRQGEAVRAVIVDLAVPEVELAYPVEANLISPAGQRLETSTVRFVGRVRDAGVPRDIEGPLTLTVGGVPATFLGETFLAEVPLAAGINTLELAAADARGNSTTRSYKVVRGGAAAPSLAVVSGDGQSMVAGQAQPLSLVAVALDDAGRPVPAAALVFRVALGDGVLDGGARARKVFTGSDGRASVQYSAGTQVGAQAITVSSGPLYPNAPIAFVVNVSAASSRVLLAHSRRSFACVAGDNLPVPMEARLVDAFGNSIAAAQVTFRVAQGDAKVSGGTQLTVTTSAAGVASVVVRAPAGGSSRSIVEATSSSASALRFEVMGFAAGPAADTALAGSVLDERGQPVAGAQVRVQKSASELEAITDPSGGFVIAGVPSGDLLVEAASAAHGEAAARLFAIPGRENRLDAPLRCVRLNGDAESAGRARSESVSPSRGALLSLPALPGLRLEILPGSATFPDGSKSGTITLLAPNLMALPAPAPDDIFVEVPVAIFPEGVVFSPPAKISLPNLRARPGQTVPLYLHRASSGSFLEIPGGLAQEDGAAITALAGRGAPASGFYFFSQPGPPGGRTGALFGKVDLVSPGFRDVPQQAESQVLGFNVYAHSGELFIDEADLELPAPGVGLHYRFRRRYESRHNFSGSLGHNWEHEYEDRRLYPGLAGGNVVRADGAGRFDEYLWDAVAGRFVSPVGIFSRLFAAADGFWIEREPDGTRCRYHPLNGSSLAGRLESITDRNGSRLTFNRDSTGLIGEARDAVGRSISYQHDSMGRISSVTDFTGRTVSLAYDAAGDLVSVTRPAVMLTPTENNFPDGKRREYIYSSGSTDERLNHNLIQVMDPREAAAGKIPRVTIEYGVDPAQLSFDRVVSEAWGGTNATGVLAGGTVSFAYESLSGASAETISPDEVESFLLSEAGITHYLDQENRAIDVTWSGAGLPLSLRVYTQASGFPRDPKRLHPPPGTRPPYYETRWSWTREGLLASRVEPRGDRFNYLYDESAPLRYAQRALLRLEHDPAPGSAPLEGGGPAKPAVTTYRRDPFFGVVVEEVPPRGNDLDFEPPLGGPGGPARYATRRFLDYQEGNPAAELADDAGITTGEVAEALAHAGVPLGLGDLNADSNVFQRAGNVVKEVPPPATLPDGARDESFATFTYNQYGQLISQVDGDGRVVRLEYHPQSDPDGDGTPNPVSGLDTGTGGFLSSRTVDLAHDPPGSITTSFLYDPLGFLASTTDGNGNQAFFVYNPLGQLVEYRLPPPLKYRRHFLYDEDDNLIRVRIENYTSTDAGGHFLVGDNRWLDTDLEYDLLGRPVSVTREVSEGEVGLARSLTTRYRYSPSGALARIIHPAPGTDEAWSHDERNLAVTHTRGEGSGDEARTATLRDENGNIVLEIDAADSDGQGGNEVQERRYDGLGRLAAVIDAAGGARVLEHDIEGQELSESVLGSPGGPTPAQGAGGVSDGNVLLSRTCWQYDERGRVFETRRARFGGESATGSVPEVLIDHFWRDAAGRVLRQTDPGGAETTFTYDGAGRRTRETDSTGNTRSFTYDGNGNVIRELSELYTLDPVQPQAAGDLDYDAAGRFREVSNVVRAYDPLNRLTLLVDPTGGVWRMRYDSSSNRILVSDSTGTLISEPTDPELSPVLDLLTPSQLVKLNSQGNRRRYTYDNIGRLVEARHELRQLGEGSGAIDATNPFNDDGIITEKFEWDDDGRLFAWTNDAGNRTEITYDFAGYVARKTWPDGSLEAYTRDRDGNLQTLVDANGTTIRQTFDSLHRVVERTIERGPGVEGTTRQRFERDGLGRLTLAMDDNAPEDPADDSVVQLQYDSCGNVVEEHQDNFPVVTGHDRGSHPVFERYPDGSRVETPRDARGQILSLSDGGAPYAAYKHFGSGKLLEKKLAQGITLSFLKPDGSGVLRNRPYDVTGEPLEQIYLDDGGGVLHGFEYGRERNGFKLYERPLHTIDGHGDVWGYDSVYRVAQYLPNVFDPRFPPVDPLEKLIFFADGNHSWRLILVNQGQRRLSVNALSAYTASGDATFEYDQRGCLRHSGHLAFVYDALGRLLRIQRDSQGIGAYRYDATGSEGPEEFRGKGRRTSKEVKVGVQGQPTGTLRFIYSQDRLLEERDPDGNLLRQFRYEEDGRPAVLIAQSPSASPTAYVFLHNASSAITAVVDSLGGVQETVHYGLYGNPQISNRFGNPIESSSVANPLGFGGLYHDFESGFLLVGGRHFDPGLGRFLAPAESIFPVEPLELNGYIRGGLPGMTGEIYGPGSALRKASYLEPFRVRIPRSVPVDQLPAVPGAK